MEYFLNSYSSALWSSVLLIRDVKKCNVSSTQLKGDISMKLRLKKNKKILEFKFIPNEDKDQILSKIDSKIFEEAICPVCKEKISKDNIGIITEKSGKIVFVCNKPRCLKLNSLTLQD